MSPRGGLGRRLVSESAVYGLGGVANQALTIVLVPIYARVLGESGMGVVAVINATLSLSQLFATLALPQAFFRAYLRDADTDAERHRVLAGSFERSRAMFTPRARTSPRARASPIASPVPWMTRSSISLSAGSSLRAAP